MLGVRVPRVLNWSWVWPFTTWKVPGDAPPEVRAVIRAVAPVARPTVPTVTPRACVAAPPIKPWMTSPSPRLILGETVVLAVNWSVLARANWTRLLRLEMVFASISLAVNLPILTVEILAVERLAIWEFRVE
jgi:hypothetical protein